MSLKRHDRVALAAEQLDCALHLFLNRKSFVSALTLAGAAEEVLGRALTLQQREASLGFAYQSHNWIHEALHGTSLLWKNFSFKENFARNAVKHMRELSDISIEVDIEDAALWMLVRACDNYRRLNLSPTDQMNAFDDWFNEHVIGT